MVINIGMLRQRIAIESRANTRNADGGEVAGPWSLVVNNLAASVQPISAREFLAASSERSEVTLKIIIRFRSGLTRGMRARLISTGEVYNILGVLTDPISGREWMTLFCSQGANNG